VAAMLFACEQVLEAHPEDGSWEDIVKSQLRYHKGFLTLQEYDPSVYSSLLARLTAEVINETP
jgi:hypothetical protein